MKAYGKSVAGKVRKINEDAFLVENSPVGRLPNLFAVADGMGGHLAGEVASKMAIEGLRDFLLNNDEDLSLAEMLKLAVEKINTDIFKCSSQSTERKGMGTTLLAVTVKEGRAAIVNIGDSRLYVVNRKEKRIEQLTIDHSYVMELLLRGKITAEEAEHHPNKNLITRAIGTGESVKCDEFFYELNDGDMLLLCTDGLTNMLSNDEILKICLMEDTQKVICEKLLEEANSKGGIDNISVILYSENGGERY